MNRGDGQFDFTPLPKQLKQDIARSQHLHARRKRSMLVLEGRRLVSDAMLQPDRIFCVIVEHGAASKHMEELAAAELAGLSVYAASNRDFSALSDTRQTQGILAVSSLDVLEMSEAFTAWQGERVLFAFHCIADPGNLGAIIRTLDWFGARNIFLSEGSVHPTNPKVVRATMGSLLRTSIARFSSCEELFALAKRYGYSTVATSAAEGAGLYEWLPQGSMLLLFGGEAHGLPGEAVMSADQVINIPRAGGSESLNLAVAHGIITSYLSQSLYHASSPALLR